MTVRQFAYSAAERAHAAAAQAGLSQAQHGHITRSPKYQKALREAAEDVQRRSEQRKAAQAPARDDIVDAEYEEVFDVPLLGPPGEKA